MTLVVEDGTGVAGAESYAAVATIDDYWTARPQNPLAATWAAESDEAKKEGAAREVTAYIEATWGSFYRGTRKDYVQGLEWPRNGPLDVCDDDEDGETDDYLPVTDAGGVELPDLPPQLIAAVAELAPRALAGPLQGDVDMAARVKSQTKKVGAIQKTTEYFDNGSAPPQTSFGVVALLLAPILIGAQPNAPSGGWTWA